MLTFSFVYATICDVGIFGFLLLVMRGVMMKITVIGPGRWGSFIAWYLDSIGHDVTLYGRVSSRHMQGF